MTSRDWDARYSGDDLVWSADPNQFLVSEVAAMEPGRALDLACGEGRNAVWLAELGWNVTAVDFSPVGIDSGRRLADRAGVTVDWLVADLTTWQPPHAAFDLAIILYLHIPAPQLRAVLGGALASLAPGGSLLVVGHAIRNLTEGFGGPPVAELLYDPAQLAGELGGLILERAEEVKRPVLDDGVTRVAIDALVRARRA